VKAVKAAKKPAVIRTKKTDSQIEVLKIPSRIAESVQPSADELQALIATAAYYRAAARNFSAGGEMEDWLAAEREILATVA
jgi:phage gpG-like protein